MRTRRWASTPMTLERTRNGSMSISTRRVTALGAALVWIVEAEEDAGLVQDTHHDALEAPAGGDGRDTDVHALAGDLEGDAAVLGETLLGDVERRHDLHARDDGRHELLGGAARHVELAVD